MCTLSAVVQGDHLRVVMNRDEQRTRPTALLPRLQDRSGRLAVFPIDPTAQGTWIAVTDAGMVFALLNRTSKGEPKCEPSRDHVSRGRMILDLLDADTPGEVARRVREVDPTIFAPFRLAAIEGESVSLFTSDGQCISNHRHDVRQRNPFMVTSSGLGDELVGPPRTTLFNDMVANPSRGGAAIDIFERQDAYHAHQWLARPELSVMMNRADARTVSRTVVDVRPTGITMTYLAEESGAEPIRLELSRTHPSWGELRQGR